MIKKYYLYIIIGIGLFTGCTDRDFAKFRSYGGKAVIKCYSGNKLIYSGISTGKVEAENSGIFSFVDIKTNKLIKSNANCIVKYLEY